MPNLQEYKIWTVSSAPEHSKNGFIKVNSGHQEVIGPVLNLLLPCTMKLWSLRKDLIWHGKK